MWDHERSDISHSDWCDGKRDEDGNCPLCEARFAEEAWHYRALYEGEKTAGLHSEFTEEGLNLKHSWRRDYR